MTTYTIIKIKQIGSDWLAPDHVTKRAFTGWSQCRATLAEAVADAVNADYRQRESFVATDKKSRKARLAAADIPARTEFTIKETVLDVEADEPRCVRTVREITVRTS